MAVSLLELAKNYLSDEIVNQVGDRVGENQSNTQKAIDGALPTVLSGLVQKAEEPGGPSSIMDMIGEVMSPNRVAGDVILPHGGIATHLSDLLTDDTHARSLLSMGASILQSLFGAKTDETNQTIASYSGVKPSSAASIMSLAGPVLLSILGQKLANDGTGILGLVGLLREQRTHIQSAFPAGLAPLLGSISGLGLASGSTSGVNDPFATTGGQTLRPTSPIGNAASPTGPVPTPTPSHTNNEDRSSGTRWLPWILLLLGVLALFYFLRSCRHDGNDTVTATTDSVSTTTDQVATDVSATADSVGSNVSAAIDTAGNALSEATAKLGAFFKRKLPSGRELNIPENGIENNLVKFIEDKSRPVDKMTWFNFDRILFDTGKATLKPSSQEQLDNIASILKEYPNVTIKVGGYTDNTGSAAVNKKLSQERADSVTGELIKLGVDKSRMEAEGYGPEHPVASNDTEAGRAENRRIAIRVTKK